jgi:hypothetical protein
VDIWCAGSTGGSTGFTGKLYKTRIWIPTGTTSTPYQTSEVPNSVELFTNYPNPFNPETIISFNLPHSTFVTLSVYDVLGREVARLASEWKTAGNHRLRFDGTSLSSGMYSYQLVLDRERLVRHMVLVK